MHFHKIRHPVNFHFAPANTRLVITARDCGDDVFHILATDGHRRPDYRVITPQESGAEKSRCRLICDEKTLRLEVPGGDTPLLEGVPDRWLGVCGEAWLAVFRRAPECRFYGMGEKNNGFERGGKRTKFWNTDIFADFPMHEIEYGVTDPMYAAIPYIIVKRGNRFAAVYIDNPGVAFADTGSNYFFSGKDDMSEVPAWWAGADHGRISFYVIVGPSLAELTEKFQRLAGATPRPPLWALGHHQCRWGYSGERDLDELDRAYAKHRIPCDGLWLDIDYMDRFRVFTCNPKTLPHPRETLTRLRERGRRIVAILDPGVKMMSEDLACREGLTNDLFCHNPAGSPFVGFVWPGRTHFPDFSLPETRRWWAGRVAEFARLGFAGAWLDMNDPSVGAIEPDDMLFRRGRWPHHAFHNQYALGMAMASRDGFLQARPNERPFLLTRSGSFGIGRFSALWTGDNCSNYHHLAQAIPVSVNLALSGVPFNGPDVGGFAGDTTPELLVDWYKAGFLFPFFRNHSAIGTRPQEPWKFGAKRLAIIRHYIALRYKLLPYLYQLFIRQETHQEAILRPLFYDFPDTPGLPLDNIDDQCLIGPCLMIAPFVRKDGKTREVRLPGLDRWFDAATGQWLRAPGKVQCRRDTASTPVFVRDGAIIPMAPKGEAGEALNRIEFHIFADRHTNKKLTADYVWDDGISFEYKEGKQSRIQLAGKITNSSALEIMTKWLEQGYEDLNARFVVCGSVKSLSVNGEETPLKEASRKLTGKSLKVRLTPWLRLS